MALVKGIPPNRPGRQSNGCAKLALRLSKRSRVDWTRSPWLLLAAKAEEDWLGNQCAGGHAPGSLDDVGQVRCRRHFAPPYQTNRSGSASATEEGFAWRRRISR